MTRKSIMTTKDSKGDSKGDKDSGQEETTRYETNSKQDRLKNSQYSANFMQTPFESKSKSKLATKCEHPYRQFYSKGLCQSCYLQSYYRNKRKQKQQEKVRTHKN